jgi:hypothetical protein
LVLGPDGERLAKRHQSAFSGSTIDELRASGVKREEILGEMGAALGILDAPTPIAMAELIAKTHENTLKPRGPWRVPARWVRPR